MIENTIGLFYQNIEQVSALRYSFITASIFYEHAIILHCFHLSTIKSLFLQGIYIHYTLKINLVKKSVYIYTGRYDAVISEYTFR